MSLESFSQEDNIQLELLQTRKIKSMEFALILLKKENQELKNTQDALTTKQVKQDHLLDTMQVDITDKFNVLKTDLTNQYEKINYQQSAVTKNYVGLTGLGSFHSPNIGSQYMGKLLRKVGICNEFGNTQPKSNFTSGKEPLSINYVGTAGFPSFLYHTVRTWALITKRIDDMGIRNEFESCKTKDELHEFINGI